MEKLKKSREYKVERFRDGVEDFKISLEIRIDQFAPSVSDTLKSGQVQKFEVCAELMWKAVRAYLLDVNGVECRSPKQAVKEFYNLSYVSAEDFEKMLGLLDDRNALSHTYSKEQFEEIYTRISKVLPVFHKVLGEMEERIV